MLIDRMACHLALLHWYQPYALSVGSAVSQVTIVFTFNSLHCMDCLYRPHKWNLYSYLHLYRNICTDEYEYSIYHQIYQHGHVRYHQYQYKFGGVSHTGGVLSSTNTLTIQSLYNRAEHLLPGASGLRTIRNKGMIGNRLLFATKP